jgi:flagellar biosynthesis protein FlhF
MRNPMTTRVFRARTLIDARLAATAALGEDAVVLTTREVRRPGLLGVLGATEVEIAAAALPRTERPAQSTGGPFAAATYGRPQGAVHERDLGGRSAALDALRTDLRSEIRAVRLAMGRPAPSSRDGDMMDLAAEVSAIREALELLAPSKGRGDKVSALLRARGIEGPAALALARKVRSAGAGDLDERLRAALASTLRAAEWPAATKGRRGVIAVVGPSGVGKTTTLAKLATLARAAGQTVTLVTCDTFRVGGVEQVRRYATLLDVRFEAVRNAGELAAVLGRTTTDLVFVDTSGRAPAAEATELLLAERSFASNPSFQPFDRHVLLCMAATSREVDALRTVKSFAPASPTALAITKLDETSIPSGIVHAAWASKLAVALTCSGQRVPEDIEACDVARLVEQLVPRAESRKAKAA